MNCNVHLPSTVNYFTFGHKESYFISQSRYCKRTATVQHHTSIYCKFNYSYSLYLFCNFPLKRFTVHLLWKAFQSDGDYWDKVKQLLSLFWHFSSITKLVISSLCGCVHEAAPVSTSSEMFQRNDTFAVLETQRLSCEVFSQTGLFLSLIQRGRSQGYLPIHVRKAHTYLNIKDCSVPCWTEQRSMSCCIFLLLIRALNT